MKAPWRGKTGLAKAAAILASVLTISLGLCGANFFAFTHAGSIDSTPQGASLGSLLIYTGYAELFAILGSFLGLIVVLLMYAFRRKPEGRN
jgi:hypothetical protein